MGKYPWVHFGYTALLAVVGQDACSTLSGGKVFARSGISRVSFNDVTNLAYKKAPYPLGGIT